MKENKCLNLIAYQYPRQPMSRKQEQIRCQGKRRKQLDKSSVKFLGDTTLTLKAKQEMNVSSKRERQGIERMKYVRDLAERIAKLSLTKITCSCGRQCLPKNLKRHKASKICKRVAPFDQKAYCKKRTPCPTCKQLVLKHQLKRHMRSCNK